MTKSVVNSKNDDDIGRAMMGYLADNYALYIKTQNFHWNVEGPHFHDLHALFQTHYEDLAIAIDEIAERIRMCGHYAPGSFSKFADLTSLKEQNDVPKDMDMVKELANDHEVVAAHANKIVKMAQDHGDEGTADLLIGRVQVHEKAAWMLRAILG